MDTPQRANAAPPDVDANIVTGPAASAGCPDLGCVVRRCAHWHCRTLIHIDVTRDRSGLRGRAGALAAAVVGTLQPTLAERGVAIVCGGLPTVRGDGPQLGQVLQNLIGNAAKFGATRIEVDAAQEGESWVVSVADDGPGVPPDRAEEIFGTFARLEADPGVPGSGIGLAIAARVLERHGGRIWVEGRPGGGSVFRFSLPPEPAG